MRRVVALAFAYTVFAGLTPAQGAGLVGSNGLEPRVRVTGWTVGQPSVLVVDRLVPSTGPNLVIGVSPVSGHVDLTPFGAPGGALGFPLSPPPTLLPFRPVPASGSVALTFTVHPSVIGATFYLQAGQLDPLAPVGGLGLSDTEVLTFGGTDERVIASMGVGPSSQDLGVFFADGSATGPVLPDLVSVEILDVTLAAVGDTLPLDGSRPYRDASVPGRVAIRFPSGRALYHYRDGSGRFGFFVVDELAVRLERLIDAPAVAGADPFDQIIAVSPFEPMIAVIGEGVPGVLLIRVDGENQPGSASPVRAVTFAGTLAGFEPQEESLTFAQGALFCTDGVQVARVPMVGAPQEVVLPPSGGLVPGEVDDEFAWSADGSAVAFTAGVSPALRDVYVVDAGGVASNVTQAPGAYEEVGHGDLADGGRLALAPDGSRIAYVKEIAGSPEVFVQDAVPTGVQTHVTPNNVFVSTIDQEVTIHFYNPDKLTLAAGSATNDHDVYEVSLTGLSVTNLTVTGNGTQPFGPGALSGADFGAVAGGGAAYVMEDGAGARRLMLLDPNGQPSLAPTTTSAAVSGSPSGGGALLALSSASGASIHRVVPGTGPVLVASPQESVRAVIGHPTTGDAVAMLTQVNAEGLLLLPSLGTPVVGPTAQAWTGGFAPRSGGGWFGVANGSGQASLVAVDGAGSSATVLSVSGVAFVY